MKSLHCSGRTAPGKTTLIGIICGIVDADVGQRSLADGHDIREDYRAARAKIGLVPQELTTMRSRPSGPTVQFQSRPVRQAARIRPISKRCCATCRYGTRRTASILALSGGMKRRVMIAEGAVARAADPVPRRADRGRRRRAAT